MTQPNPEALNGNYEVLLAYELDLYFEKFAISTYTGLKDLPDQEIQRVYRPKGSARDFVMSAQLLDGENNGYSVSQWPFDKDEQDPEAESIKVIYHQYQGPVQTGGPVHDIWTATVVKPRQQDTESLNKLLDLMQNPRKTFEPEERPTEVVKRRTEALILASNLELRRRNTGFSIRNMFRRNA